MRNRHFAVLAGVLAAASASADLIGIVAGRDTTLYSDATANELSNGGGSYLFAGQTGVNAAFNLRRGLVWFDVAGALPAGAVITDVSLRLFATLASPLGPATVDVNLHRALQDWGENLLSDPADPEGSGTAAQPGDATWQHAFFNTTAWTSPGGDFAAAASATGSIGTFGTHLIGGGELAADVQAWYDDPGGNYGWFLIGPETTPNSARRFFSRNGGDADNAPTLVVEYTVVPEPAAAMLVLLGLGICAAAGRGVSGAGRTPGG